MHALLVTDLSEAGLASVHGLLACGTEGFERVTLLHVIDLDQYTAGGSVPQLQEWAVAGLEKAAGDLRERGFTVDVRVEVGPTVPSIQRVAEELGASLVVTTSLGKSAVVGRLLGSTAERIPAETNLPVLIERVGREGERWCRVGSASPFSRILLGVDLVEDPAALLDRVLRFPGVQAVRLVHVAADETAREEAETKLRAVTQATTTRTAVDAVAVTGDPAESVLAEAKAMDSTAVCVTSRRHGMLHRGVIGSVAREIAVRADRAVLLLPPQ